MKWAQNARVSDVLRQSLYRLVVRQENPPTQLGQQMTALQPVVHGAFDLRQVQLHT